MKGETRDSEELFYDWITIGDKALFLTFGKILDFYSLGLVISTASIYFYLALTSTGARIINLMNGTLFS